MRVDTAVGDAESGGSAGAVLLGIFFFQAEDGIRDTSVTGVQTCALPISLVLLGPFDDVGADAPGAQCFEVGRSGDRIVFAIVLIRRLDGDFLAVRAHAFVAERQATGGGSVGARLAPRHRSTRRLAGVELPGSDYRIRSGPGGENDRRDREEGTRGEPAEHGLQWPWPTAVLAPAGPVAARSRCSTRPTVLRASRPTCSTRRAATPGEDGAEGTLGEDGAGSTPGEDGVDSMNGAMSLRYLCRCCCSSRRRSSS